jgi:ABC-type branched-subunit amino acid transport system substrate-binding protein
MRKEFIILYLMVSVVFTLRAQDPVERERDLLYRNIDLYRSGRYEKAIQNFSLMIERLPESRFITTNYLMKAKSEYKNGQYMASLESVKNFLNKFPRSGYQDEIYYVMGNNYYKLNRYKTAIGAWEKGINLTEDPELLDKLGYLISETARYKLNEGDIRELGGEITSDDGQVLLAIAHAEMLMDLGSNYQAQQVVGSVVNTYPRSRFIGKARKLLTTGAATTGGDLKIALLVPLTGFNAEIGNAIKTGAEFAIREYNQTAAKQLNLVIRDYGEDITTAIRFYKEFAGDPDVLAVLGPLENDISAACAAISDYEKLLLISPTATDNDLTALSDHFIQINSTLQMRAKMLAGYAVDSLKIRRFATFSPVENHFAMMVDEFTDVIRSKSADVVTQQWYYPADQDLHKQFMNIKRIALRYAFSDSLKTLDPLIDSLTIDSLYVEYRKQEQEQLNETRADIDSADIAVGSIGGVFIPIYKEDIKFIAPQIAYSNIQSQYIGNGDWYNPTELVKNKNYINGLIFISDGFLDEENWDYRNFKNKYRVATNTTPTTYNLIGYDCLRFMIKPFEKGAVILGRTDYAAKLEHSGRFEGLYRKIQLDDRNRNTLLRLLQFNYGQIIPLN